MRGHIQILDRDLAGLIEERDLAAKRVRDKAEYLIREIIRVLADHVVCRCNWILTWYLEPDKSAVSEAQLFPISGEGLSEYVELTDMLSRLEPFVQRNTFLGTKLLSGALFFYDHHTLRNFIEHFKLQVVYSEEQKALIEQWEKSDPLYLAGVNRDR